MDLDKTTYEDLSIFNHEEEYSVFHQLDFTTTAGGKDWLRYLLSDPSSDLKKIISAQQIICLIRSRLNEWPSGISNGTLMVMARYYDTALDRIPMSNDVVNTWLYKVIHSVDYGLIKYSMIHFRDFIIGMDQLVKVFDDPSSPARLQLITSRIKSLLQHRQLQEMLAASSNDIFSTRENLFYGFFFREGFKDKLFEMIDMYCQLDAWYSMARAVEAHDLSFPEFIDSDEPYVKANGLFHILLPEPVAYDVELSPKTNFLFLTGANMAGKSTFIKSVGVATYLAHVGMGVPAKQMQLSVFDGILSNINVVDNIAKGESYFYNEVQRIKNTILKITDGRKWLVLIDELFKGTNVQDAMKCSSVVIRGLIKIKTSLFILSTHLYEIGEELKSYPNISFKYFETSVNDDRLSFSYQLKDGISNDRLGYFILKSEKVVEMLERI
mgnify:FL=1